MRERGIGGKVFGHWVYELSRRNLASSECVIRLSIGRTGWRYLNILEATSLLTSWKTTDQDMPCSCGIETSDRQASSAVDAPAHRYGTVPADSPDQFLPGRIRSEGVIQDIVS